MQYSLLFSQEIPNNSRKRYKEIYLGFSWIVVFYSFLVPFFKDRAIKLGWLMVGSQFVGFFISGILGETLGSRMVADITTLDQLLTRAYINFLSTCFVWFVISCVWGYYYNILHIRYILKEGYVPEDEYTKNILKEQDITYNTSNDNPNTIE